MKAPLLALLALATAGALTLFLLVRGDGGVAAAQPVAAAPSADGAHAAGTTAPREGTPASAVGRREEPLLATAAAGDPAAAPPGEALPDGRRVQVVDSRGAPVPGALVLVPDPPDEDADEDARDAADALRRHDLFAWFAEHAKRYDCDEAGVARIPPGTSDRVYGYAPGRIGAANLRDGNVRKRDAGELPPATLLVVPDRDLLVRVVDPSGAPLAGVPVCLRAEGSAPNWSFSDWEGTGVDGTLRIGHLPAVLPETLGAHAERLNGLSTLRAYLPLPLTEPVEAPVPVAPDDAGPGVDEVLLQAPESGSLVVHVVDSNGATLDLSGEVYVARIDERLERALEQEDPSLPWMVRWRQSPAGRSLSLQGGVARMPVVELGLDLAVSVEDHDQSVVPVARVHGPDRPGEEVQAEIESTGPSRVLVVRVAGADGAPIPESQVVLRVSTGGMGYGQTRETDTSGLLSLELPPMVRIEGEWSLSLRIDPDSDREPGLEGKLTSQRVLQPGENDLGQVTLSPMSLLVAGRVVGPEDEPAAGIDVRLMLQPRGVDAGRPDRMRGPIRSTTSDASGHFVLFGHEDDSRWPQSDRYRRVLSARGPLDQTDDLVPFEPGDEDVVLHLERAGVLQGRLEVPPLLRERAASGRWLWVRARPRGDPDRLLWPSWSSDLAFRFESLQPGLWDLVVQVRGDPRPTRVVESIDVPAGGLTDDPRLDPVTLPDLALHRLSLVASGETLPTVFQLGKREPGTDDWGDVFESESVRRDETGPYLPLLVGSDGLDVLVRGQGLRDVVLEDVHGDRDVVLGNGIPVRIALAGGSLEQLSTDCFLVANLSRRSPRVFTPFVPVERDHATATVRVPAPGTYRVRLRIELESGRWSEEVSLQPDEDSVTVPAGARSTSLVLHPDPDGLRALDEEVHQREAASRR